jgi:hypothetical protein
MSNDGIYAVTSELFDYVKSPSLRHIRDPHSIQRLAKEIVQSLDRASSVWKKWEGSREEFAKAASCCWIPAEDLLTFLNGLPGPALTRTDVIQRLRALWEEPWATYPNEELKAGCLALYESEKAQGTELPAIVGALQEHIELEEERLRREREENYRRNREEERIRLEQKFLSGADCGWTQVKGSVDLYCRRNARAFRIARGKCRAPMSLRIIEPERPGFDSRTFECLRGVDLPRNRHLCWARLSSAQAANALSFGINSNTAASIAKTASGFTRLASTLSRADSRLCLAGCATGHPQLRSARREPFRQIQGPPVAFESYTEARATGALPQLPLAR